MKGGIGENGKGEEREEEGRGKKMREGRRKVGKTTVSEQHMYSLNKQHTC